MTSRLYLRHQTENTRWSANVPGLHLLCLEAAGGRCGAAGLLAELHQGLVVLLLLLLLLLVARQDEEEAQDAL